MALNKSVGNMYEWVDWTWNPIKGCEFDCKYCYIKANRNYNLTPRISEGEFNVDLTNKGTIFVGSMCDMFGDWIPKEWIKRVLQKCRQYNNRYLFQSKNPMRFHEFIDELPQSVILGTTIETNRRLDDISKAPSPMERALVMSLLWQDMEVTIEPILDFDLYWMIRIIKIIKPKFVAIGADSKGHGLEEPEAWKIKELIKQLELFTLVKPKKNLRRIYDEPTPTTP